jgi:hypothetical protein
MKMTQDELNEIIRKHGLWLHDEDGGERANLAYANLADANLACADLADANLACADLAGADLACANLSDANLACADLADANLACANLSDANLADANLAGADLSGANLAGADLAGANLAGIKGIEIMFPIINIRGTQHILFSIDNNIRIGCEHHSIQFWIDNYKTIGEEYKYSPEEIKEYYKYILMVADVRKVEVTK